MNSRDRKRMEMVSTIPGVEFTREKPCYGTHANVWLDDEQIEILKKKYWNCDEMIETLSRFKFDKEKEYVSDFVALLTFGRLDGQLR